MSTAAACKALKPAVAVASPAPVAASDVKHYVIDSSASDVRILVYKRGILRVFGHNHVIRAAQIKGDVFANRDFSRSGFELTLPVASFRVDQPAERAKEGRAFAEQPSAKAVADTTHNMLGKAVLDAARFPVIEVRSVKVDGSPAHPVVVIRIDMHGVQRQMSVPLKIAISASRLIASGRFAVRQTDFDIRPFSLLGGGLRVADTVQIHFRIVADRQ